MRPGILYIIITAFILISGTSPKMTTREREMLAEINYARTKPGEYTAYFDAFLDHWNAPASERKKAQELKRYMKKMAPVPTLLPSEKLYHLARTHGEWLYKNQTIRHSQHKDISYSENIVGGNENVRYAVIDLLIDAGYDSNAHRKNILNPENRYAACYEVSGKVKNMPYVFVQQFSKTEQ